MENKIVQEIDNNYIKIEELKEELRSKLALIHGYTCSELGEIKRQNEDYIPRSHIKEIQKLGNEISEIDCKIHTLKENNEVLKMLKGGVVNEHL